MNNEYDRDDGLMVTNDSSDDSVKLILLQSGEQIVARVGSHPNASVVTLKDPRGVVLQSTTQSPADTEEEGEVITSTISYGIWFPLSKSRDITINGNYIVAIEDPIESLKQSYIAQTVEVID